MVVMSDKFNLEMTEQLIKRRHDIYQHLAHLELERDTLCQHRSTETVEGAQKECLSCINHKLCLRGREEIKEINLALDRIAEGTYGICQLCKKKIPLKRLKILPATRFCRMCAMNYEQVQYQRRHLRDEIVDDALLDEYRSLKADNLSVARLRRPRHQNSIGLKDV
jgi:RNA polymerase-binding transcription factor DksA